MVYVYLLAYVLTYLSSYLRRSSLLETMTTIQDIPVNDDEEGGEGGGAKPIKASKLLWGLALQVGM